MNPQEMCQLYDKFASFNLYDLRKLRRAIDREICYKKYLKKEDND